MTGRAAVTFLLLLTALSMKACIGATRHPVLEPTLPPFIPTIVQPAPFVGPETPLEATGWMLPSDRVQHL